MVNPKQEYERSRQEYDRERSEWITARAEEKANLVRYAHAGNRKIKNAQLLDNDFYVTDIWSETDTHIELLTWSDQINTIRRDDEIITSAAGDIATEKPKRKPKRGE